LVNRESANSRGKDLYDLTVLFEILGATPLLRESIENTFQNRATPLPKSFQDFFAALDLTVLQNSWGAVELQRGEMSFADCLKKLKAVLEKVDELLGTR
jgi:hypothetical protein